MLYVLWPIVLAWAVFLYLRKTYSRLSQAGVNHLPVTPFFGHFARMLLKREHIVETLAKSYRAFPDDNVVGMYEFTSPVMLLKDREMFKKVCIKDPDHFTDRRSFPDELKEPLLTKNLLFIGGNEWKPLRISLTPIFTSSKIRQMVPLIIEVGDLMVKQLSEEIVKSGVGYIDIDSKVMSSRCAAEVIASCALHLKPQSFRDKNLFHKNCNDVVSFSMWDLVKLNLVTKFPILLKVVNMHILPKSVSDFFKNLVFETMRMREEHGIVSHDVIHLLKTPRRVTTSHASEDVKAGSGNTNYEKHSDQVWSDIYIAAQASVFIVAGFETVSGAVAFLILELAQHPEVQRKLYQEIRKHWEDNHRKIEYDSIKKLPYLDMVISEVLRLWPPAPAIERTCVKDYNLGRPNKQAKHDLIVRKSEDVKISIWAVHRDPRFFPDPDKFDPERFSEENRADIKPLTYMPFGLGARSCIATRFAVCEMKVLVYQLMLHLELHASERTRPPHVLLPEFRLRVRGGSWVRCTLRDKL